MAISFPTITVDAAFTTDPASTPSWTSISAYARGFSTRRGRQFELDRMQTGVASLRLNNADRRFDPTYTGGAYYPNVKPMKRVRICATWDSQTYPVYAGYAERWPQGWGLNGKLAEVILPLVDGFAVCGYSALNSSYSAELTGARIDHVLTDVGWGSGSAGLIDSSLLDSTMILSPVGDRAIDLGLTTCKATTLANAVALDHLLGAAESENGRFFMSADGTATFHQRRLASQSSMATFGDAGGTNLPYSDLLFEEAPIWNEARYTAVGGVEQVATDTTSQGDYFRRSDVRSGFLHDSDSELASLASWRVNRYKDPIYRIRSVVIHPQKSPTALWPQVLGRAIGDCVTVNRQPPGGVEVISQTSIIEGIEHEVTPDTWVTRFWLSAADTSSYLILDNSISGLLDLGRLGY